ncbi:G2F domain [Desmophyllum pertusum]|uniref:G2F domain n=1 Tax=Desmophyllum pertusum TaxID=174260 RepID=A0A9W9Z847_9CNID|nr:G2F domain [Desmophyllum pertusum]
MIAEVYLQQTVPWFSSTKILKVPKGHYAEMNFTMQSYYPSPCLDGIYLEVRDGNKQSANLLVAPSLDQVAKTQFALYNHSASLWCPAQGAPAPYIVWRKNGTVVQNSTSVRYQLNITEEKNEKYSCEVDRPDGLDKKEINLIVESKIFIIIVN